MKILAIESSGNVASVAIVNESQIVAEYTLNHKKTHSVTLMPMIKEMTEALELDIHTLDGIAISAGPGSYTGLRIGSATAKGLAHALEIPIFSVPTLEVLASQLNPQEGYICSMIDARREEVYGAVYQWQNGKLICLIEAACLPLKVLLEQIKGLKCSSAIVEDVKAQEKQVSLQTIFIGDAINSYKNKIVQYFEGEKYAFAPYSINIPRASVVGQLAIELAGTAHQENYMDHHPIYLKKTQAEREYEEKHGASIES